MSGYTALYDACVLYPAPLRDLLLQLALTGLFRARWSATIHDEWTRNVLLDRPDLTAAQLQTFAMRPFAGQRNPAGTASKILPFQWRITFSPWPRKDYPKPPVFSTPTGHSFNHPPHA